MPLEEAATGVLCLSWLLFGVLGGGGGGTHVGDIHAYKEGLRRSMYGTVRD